MAKNFAITFPQCGEVDLHDVALSLREHVWPAGAVVKYVIVVEEKHEDGNPHLHIALSFDKAIHVNRPTVFDFSVPGHHANVKAMSKESGWISYIFKDPEARYAEWGIDHKVYLEAHAEKKSTKIAMVADMLTVRRMTPHQIMREVPDLYLQHRNKINQFFSDWNYAEKADPTIKWAKCHAGDNRPATAEIADWLNLNLGEPRGHKQPQLWIYGEKNLGKSYLAMQLSKRFYTYWASRETFFDNYDDHLCELVIFDEFSSDLKFGFFQNFLEGQPMSIPVKGSQKMKFKNPPCVVLSNLHPDDCYPNVEPIRKEALKSRFTIVHIDVQINIVFDEVNEEEAIVDAPAEEEDEDRN